MTRGPPGDLGRADREGDLLRRHVEAGKAILQQPIRKQSSSPSDTSSSPRYGRIISPKLLQIPEVDPETFFSDDLLPRVPADAGKQLILDIGANKGQFAETIAKFGHDGICFEPTPSVCSQLKRNVEKILLTAKKNSHIQVLCAAVGARAGKTSFSMNESAHAGFHMVSAGEKVTRAIEVPVVTLDEVVPKDREILPLKTDTQGFEMGVLEGAQEMLIQRRPHLLIVEMSYGLLGRAGSSPLKLMQKIDGYGYVCSQTQFFGRPSLSDPERTGRIPWERVAYEGSISLQEMHDRLKSLPPNNKSGWTDLLCWRNYVSGK